MGNKIIYNLQAGSSDVMRCVKVLLFRVMKKKERKGVTEAAGFEPLPMVHKSMKLATRLQQLLRCSRQSSRGEGQSVYRVHVRQNPWQVK